MLETRCQAGAYLYDGIRCAVEVFQTKNSSRKLTAPANALSVCYVCQRPLKPLSLEAVLAYLFVCLLTYLFFYWLLFIYCCCADGTQFSKTEIIEIRMKHVWKGHGADSEMNVSARRVALNRRWTATDKCWKRKALSRGSVLSRHLSQTPSQFAPGTPEDWHLWTKSFQSHWEKVVGPVERAVALSS